MKPARRGYTLVEMLAVIAVFSTTLTIIALTLHGLQKSSQRVHNNLTTGNQQARFVHQLRRDAHEAQTFTTGPAERGDAAPTILQLTMANASTVEYHLYADRIERIARQGDALLHQESYRVTPITAQGWSILTTGARPLASVGLQRPAISGVKVPPTVAACRVEAVLGLQSSPVAQPTAESNP